MDNKVCGKFNGPGRDGQKFTVKCRRPLKGHRMRIQMNGRGILSLAEVEVKGHSGMYECELIFVRDRA